MTTEKNDAPSAEALEHKTGCFAESGLYVQGRGYNRVRGCYSCGVEQHFPDGLNIPRYTFDRGGYPHSDDEGGFVAYSSVEEFVARVRREARAEAFEEGAKRSEQLSEHDAETLALEDAAPHDKQIRVQRRVIVRRAVAAELRALAAKERAK